MVLRTCRHRGTPPPHWLTALLSVAGTHGKLTHSTESNESYELPDYPLWAWQPQRASQIHHGDRRQDKDGYERRSSSGRNRNGVIPSLPRCQRSPAVGIGMVNTVVDVLVYL